MAKKSRRFKKDNGGNNKKKDILVYELLKNGRRNP